MRTRNRSTQLIFPDSNIVETLYNGRSSAMRRTNFTDSSEVMVDQVNPGYFRAERTGTLKPVSKMSQTSVRTDVLLGTVNFEMDTYWGPRPDQRLKNNFVYRGRGILGPFNPALFTQPPLPEVNKGVLLQQALASAQTNAFDKLTFAAEFHKTVEMFATAQQRYKRHWERVSAQAQRNAASNRNKYDKGIDFITEAWFDLRFGLRPVIYDIEAAQEFLRRLLEGSPVLSRGWASASNDAIAGSGFRRNNFSAWSFQGVASVEIGSAAIYGTSHEVAQTWTTTVEGRASVGVNVTTRDLTMADPILTLWELTPMSVFFDYFVSIGDMLAAFSPFATGHLAFATYTRTVTHELVAQARWVAVSSEGKDWRGESSPSSVVQTRVFKERTLESVAPTLAVNVQLDLARVLDLLALAWTLRRSLASLTRLLTRR